MRRLIGKSGAAAIVLLLLGGAYAHAAPGDRDSHWGTYGVSGKLPGSGYSLAATPDGGALVFTIADRLGYVTKLSASGQVANSFGDSGVVTAPSSMSPDRMAATPDGGFVIAGTLIDPGATTRTDTVELAKYTGAGRPDTSFGSAGIATFTTPSTYTLVDDMTVSPNGTIGLLVGAGAGGGIVELNSDASPRYAFGIDGFAQTDLHDLNVLVRDDQGRYLVGGSTDASTFALSPVLARFLPDGSPDGAFGSGGEVRFDQQADIAGIPDIALDASGRLLALTFSNDGISKGYGDRRFLRLNPDGSLDPSFMPPQVPGALVGNTALDPAGRIILTGTTVGGYGSNRQDPTVIRMLSDGSLDQAFGNGGVVVMPQLNVGAVGLSQPFVSADGNITALADASDFEHGTRVASTIRLLGSPGSPDADGDGIRDRKDDCPTNAGGHKTNGCPLLKRQVTISYRLDDNYFTGEVTGPAGCVRRGTLRLYRVVPGPDEVVGSVRRNLDPWSIAGKFKADHYYAEVGRTHNRSVGICKAARSHILGIQPY